MKSLLFFLLLAYGSATESDGLTCNDIRTVLSDGNCCRVSSQHDIASDIIYRQCTITTPDPAIDIDRTNLTKGYDYCEKGQMLVATGLTALHNASDHQRTFWKCADLPFVDHRNNPHAIVDHALVSGSNNTVTSSDASAVSGIRNTVVESPSSVAMGQDNHVTYMSGAVAMGQGNNVTQGMGAAAIGVLNTAMGDGTVAIGTHNVARGKGAVAFGYNSIADNDYTVAFGGTDVGAAAATAVGGMAIGPFSQADRPYCIAIGTKCAAGSSEHIITAKGMVLECEGDGHFNVGASAGISASLLRPKCPAVAINGHGHDGTCLFPFTPVGVSSEREVQERYSCMPSDATHPHDSWCQWGTGVGNWGYCTEQCNDPILPQTTCTRRRRLDSDTHIPASETHVDMVSYPTVHLGGIVHANNVVLESMSSSADRRVKKKHPTRQYPPYVEDNQRAAPP